MKLSDAIISPVVAFCLAVLAGLYAVLKMIFTNQTKIQVLETQLETMNLVLQEVRADQKQLYDEIRNLKSSVRFGRYFWGHAFNFGLYKVCAYDCGYDRPYHVWYDKVYTMPPDYICPVRFYDT